MSDLEKLKILRRSLIKNEIGLNEAVNQLVQLIISIDADKHKARIEWLQNERDGYQQSNFPGSYSPTRKGFDGRRTTSDAALRYRNQQGFRRDNNELIQFVNLMGVGEIDRWIIELDGETTAVVQESPFQVTSNASFFNVVKQQIGMRIDDLIEEVLDE